MFLSIIIPVFNTPTQCFSRCIESVLNSDNNEFEIIIVDDGSKDELSEDYVKICANYNNIRYYKKFNEGVSIARNYGISLSMGEYIAFVDADDTVSDVFIKRAYEISQITKPDLIVGRIEYMPAVETNQYTGEKDLYYDRNDISDIKLAYIKSLTGNIIQDNTFSILGSPCGRLYKKSCLENIRFPERISHWEDQIFNRVFFDNIDSAVIVSDVWYTYYQNDFSAFHSDFDQHYIEKGIQFWNVWNELNKKEVDKKLKKYYQIRDVSWFFLAVENGIVNSKCKYSDKVKQIKFLYSIDLFVNARQALKYKDYHYYLDKIKLCLFKNELCGFMILLYKLKKVYYDLRGMLDDSKNFK